MKAGEVKAGDLLITSSIPICSVMEAGETVLFHWGESTRHIDAIHCEEEVCVIPQQCPRCGMSILDGEYQKK